MTLEEVIAVQHRLGLTSMHLVYLGPDHFSLAHTQMERDMKIGRMFDLNDCPVHKWLNGIGVPPALGLFIVQPREHDGYSESFRSDAAPWGLVPVPL